MTVADKVIVITGAGSGLGRALSIGLARRGAQVVGIGSREAPLAETQALAGEARFARRTADVADAPALTRAIEAIAAELGRIDVLINNAAVYPKLAFLDQDARGWMRVLEVNVGGVANGCRAALPIMLRQGRGRIINVGSFADKAPIPNSSAYSASKGALRALTKAIGAELAGRYPAVSCFEWIPGQLKTQMSGFTGIDPEVCVDWAEQLIGLPEVGPNARIFEGNEEHLPRKSLRARLKDRLMWWRR